MHRLLLVASLVSVAPSAQAQVPGNSVGVITFSRDSTKLDEAAQHDAADIAKWQLEHPDSLLIIEGRSARAGSQGADLRLSQDRTDAVRTALVEAGADPARMILVARAAKPGNAPGRVVVRANNQFPGLAQPEPGDGTAQPEPGGTNEQPAPNAAPPSPGTAPPAPPSPGAAPPAPPKPAPGGNTILVVPGGGE